MEELFSKLTGAEKFSKIDLQHAYLQMEVDEESKPLLTINTHKGLYQYNRLPFGTSSSPAIFQRAMDQILQGIRSTVCIQDDVLVTGRSDADHLDNLNQVLQRLEDYNLTVNKEKCKFLEPRVTFYGHIVDKDGVHPDSTKLEAVRDVSAPKNVSQLRAFLGMMNHYRRFLPDLSTVLHPLNTLLQKNIPWRWTKSCEQAFCKAKDLLTSDLVVTHYDPKLPITLC